MEEREGGQMGRDPIRQGPGGSAAGATGSHRSDMTSCLFIPDVVWSLERPRGERGALGGVC